MHRFRQLPWILGCLFVWAGCGGQKPEPEVASSGAQVGYAEQYPDALQHVVENFGRNDDDARSLSTGFSLFAKELKAPNWKVVGDVYRAANDAGKSRDYVEQSEADEGARSFFTQEQEVIVKKVGGAASFAAKQKGCDAEVSGVVNRTLTETVSKRLEERLRERNEAHRIIERRRADLGKEESLTIAAQVDQISRGSYLVYVAMVEDKVRLRALLEEAEQVKKTLDEHLADERAYQAESGRTDAQKRDSEARIQIATLSKGQVEGALTQGREMEKKIEDRVNAAQKRHKDALDALLADVDKRAKDAGQKK